MSEKITITKSYFFSFVAFIVAALVLTGLVWFSHMSDPTIQIKSYDQLLKYANQGKSFDYIFDVSKEPNEKIMDGDLRYSGTITNMRIRENSIVSVSNLSGENDENINVVRTFHPDGTVDFNIKIFKNGKVINHFTRKGHLHHSVFMEVVTSPSIKL